MTHIYLRQRFQGLEIAQANLNFNIAHDGRILSTGGTWISDLISAVNTTAPRLSAQEALAAAAEQLELPNIGARRQLETSERPDRRVLFDGGRLSSEPIPVRLRYDRVGKELRLAWEVILRPRGDGWWVLSIDALSGEVLDQMNRIQHDTYEVFAAPLASPDEGARTVEVDVADSLASPFAWHDTDGIIGAEFTDSRGNNVSTQQSQTGFRPDGGPDLEFEFSLDLNLPPAENIEASVTNLFYWINLLHDVRYRYGFDEPAGNFQENNYGRGGVGGDAVVAEAQETFAPDGFGTPPDGLAPVMRFGLWPPLENARVTVNVPSGIAGDYSATVGDWGGELTPPTTADFELVEDGSGNNQGCSEPIDFTPGTIALIDRGNCEFGLKALNAQNSGAIGVVIVNDRDLPNGISTMGAGAFGNQVTIPTMMIGNADGLTVRAELPGVNATLGAGDLIARDAALDSTLIAHEYGHGVSNRLTGGPQNVSCLANLEQMGEGWSDFDSLWFTAKSADTAEQPRGIGNYVVFEPPGGPGIREFPYSTDLSINPLTYDDIATAVIPHGVGTVWAAMLWEVYWNLVDKHGFDSDLYNGTAGNNIALQLVTDGLKLQPCLPHFVDGRDAILLADQIDYAGANQCDIWRGFAKRGLGLSADSGSSQSVTDGTEAFDLPPECEAAAPVLTVSGTCPGSVERRVTGLTPNGKVVFFAASAEGSATLPAGPCTGTQLGLADPRRLQTGQADRNGELQGEHPIQGGSCGLSVQVVDAACRVSNVARVP